MAASVSTVSGGVTSALGFRAAGVSAGIKANRGLDLALLVSDGPATAAAVFTTNRAQAAPVLVSREHLARSGGTARAIIVNSGCANACTGDEGIAGRARHGGRDGAAGRLPRRAGARGLDRRHRRRSPIDKIRAGLPAAFRALAADQGAAAARAIMTTDPFPKEAAIRVSIGGRDAAIGGMAKGSGMIEPMMATMLGFVTTDAAVPQALLDRALREAVNDTFNAITVDGECSTNDSVMLLANGAGGAVVDEQNYGAFVAGLRTVCLELALGIVRGGEGATKLVTVTVTGAASSAEARKAAKAIANSLLVKTAIHGGDPNWGRLIAVAGRAGVAFELSRAAVRIGPTVLFKDGRPHDEGSPRAAEYLKGKDVLVSVDLGAGQRDLDGVDVRSERRIRAHQRGIPN